MKRFDKMFWTILSTLILAMPLWAAEETNYYAIFANGQKIGQSVETRNIAGGKVTTVSTMEMTVGRGQMPMTVKVNNTTVETESGKPLSFKCGQDMSIMSQSVEGTVDSKGILTVVSTSGGSTQRQSVPWPKDALLSEGMRLMRIKNGLKEGTAYTYAVFEPMSVKGILADVFVGPKKKLNLLGRVVQGTEIKTTMSAPTGTITAIEYVDDKMNVLKTVMSLIGMNMEVVSCTKEVAESENGMMDLLSAVILPSPQPLTNLPSARMGTIILTPTQSQKLTIPVLPNQSVSTGLDGRVTVTVRANPIMPQGAFPYTGGDPNLLAATRPTRYLESDNQGVVALARQAVGDARDAGSAVKRIEKFVNNYIQNKSLSVGYASAAEVVVSKEGDCSEHAVLAAAMCRAVGIPAQVVTGITYVPEFGDQQNIFGPHAWVRALVGNQWVNIDPTLPGGWDVSHIALGVGDGSPTDFFGMVSTLGYFKIAAVTLQK